MTINSVIDEAVSGIHAMDARRKIFSEKLLLLKDEDLAPLNDRELLEDRLILPVRNAQAFSKKVAGVDSGFADKRLFSFDLILVRAVAVCFAYDNGKLASAQYLPNYFSFPTPLLNNAALDNDEFQVSRSLQRLLEEVRLAKRAIAEFRPDYCFLDGSVIPQYVESRQDSQVKAFYHETLAEFQQLYSEAEKAGCQIVGCVEDSRGSQLRTILQKSVLPKVPVCNPALLDETYDSVLLDYLLKKGERSFAFNYSAHAKEHPILKDFDEKWAKQVHVFYLKPVDFDRPLRVEFLSNKKGPEFAGHVDEIAQAVRFLSGFHKEYAYPSVLIEADFRARLNNAEIETVYEKIVDKLSRHLKLRLRRNSRPF
ncbi:MAG: DNA double-strand break repair nuclease NurA [Candidatus Diapherotrites archaeon]|nr:DNA double-strand break repair nuclease NurA [Candidatus Diapherotrites archaeon]